LLPALKAAPDRSPGMLAAYCVALANSGRSGDAADILWPLAERSSAWKRWWVQVSSELPDAPTSKAWLDRLGQVVPTDAVMDRLMLAEAYDRLGRRPSNPALIEAAAGTFRELAAHPKSGSPVLVAAASQAERSGDIVAAENYYRRALDLDPKIWLAQNNLAMIIASGPGGNLREALELVDAAIGLQPRQAFLHDTKAYIQSKSGDSRAAAATMASAVSLDPDNAKWRVHLAEHLLNAGEHAEAAKAIAAIDTNRLNLRVHAPSVQQQLDTIRKRIKGPGLNG
jgi:tetratricopeptide (TPR) repeat protein